MIALLSERPLMVSIMLGLVAGGSIYGWLQTGKKPAAVTGMVGILLIPLVWVLSAYLVTDREAIEQLLYQTAEAVENNQFDLVYEAIGDEKTKAMARSELPKYTFTVAKINRIRSTDVIEGTFPPEADVDMSVKVTVSRGSLRNQRVLRRLILKLQKFDDDWLVVDYRHLPVTGGPDSYSNQPLR